MTPHFPPPEIRIPPAALSALRQQLGDRLSTSSATRGHYAQGESFALSYPPEAVAFPETTQEVAVIAAICHDHDIPMIPSGAGTSLEGHITAPLGGLAVNLSRMTRIVELHAGDLECVVEAGVTREALNTHLRDQGLFFPVDPGANATLGGMVSTRASGTTAVRYGTMAHNVLGLTIVQPDGQTIQTGGRARKSAAGYDLTRLYVGSEGTLGFITQVRLRLQAAPERIAAATCAFDDLGAAVQTVTDLMQLGSSVARIEFLDAVQVSACNAYSKLGLPEKPHLFLEFHGTEAGAQEQASLAAEVAAAHGGADFQWATTSEARSRLWKARHQAYFAAVALRPGAQVWTSDVCVPVSRLPETVTATQADIAAAGLVAPIVGHVGDGNFHVLFALDPASADERIRAEGVYEKMIARTLAVGGTCTGEHGIGLVKREHLLAEHGAQAVATMRAIKTALDPKGLMNPGKVFL